MVSGGFKSILVSIRTEVETKTQLLIKTFAKEIMTQKRRDTSKKTINAVSHPAEQHYVSFLELNLQGFFFILSYQCKAKLFIWPYHTKDKHKSNGKDPEPL